MEMLKNKQNLFSIALSIIIVFLVIIIVILLNKEEEKEEVVIINEEEKITEQYHIDIKGAVNNPGVYLVDSNAIVNDVIELAGGVSKNGTTNNINLSQKINDEMVIYIFTKNELKTTTTPIKVDTKCTPQIIEVNNCVKETTTTKTNLTTNISDKNIEQIGSSLININTASIEELMQLTGIGEAKAKAIIEYREVTKFQSIEDIMNISGIGEAAFAKIKDSITI